MNLWKAGRSTSTAPAQAAYGLPLDAGAEGEGRDESGPMVEAQLFPEMAVIPLPPKPSPTAALTARNKRALASGRHPATGLRLVPEHSCGDCAFHHHYDHRSKSYHKCEKHRLGESHSEASDIRVGWPACTAFQADVAGHQQGEEG